jgi:hypothetical protein
MRAGSMILFIFVAISLFLTRGVARAAEGTQPIQVALFNPVQIFPEETSIQGVRLSLLYGVNRDVHGLDLGFVKQNTGNGLGLQGGLIGLVDGGFQGWQSNAVNLISGEFGGFQDGLYNQVGTGTGLQLGFVNISETFSGMQLGVVNKTNAMEGLQIGLVNIISNKEEFPFLPIVNWSF